MLALASVGGRAGDLAHLDEAEAKELAKEYSPEMLYKYSVKHFYALWNKMTREGSNVFQ